MHLIDTNFSKSNDKNFKITIDAQIVIVKKISVITCIYLFERWFEMCSNTFTLQ